MLGVGEGSRDEFGHWDLSPWRSKRRIRLHRPHPDNDLPRVPAEGHIKRECESSGWRSDEKSGQKDQPAQKLPILVLRQG